MTIADTTNKIYMNGFIADLLWEGRYKTGLKDNGWAKYSSVYARSYSECSQKLQAAKNGCISKKDSITVGQLFEQWICYYEKM